MSDVANYIFEKTRRQTFLIWLCPVCGEQITEIDGEMKIGCEHYPVEEKEADKEKTNEVLSE